MNRTDPPPEYRPDNMLGNLVAVIEEYGDGDYGIAEDRLWDRFGPLIDQVQTELGLEE